MDLFGENFIKIRNKYIFPLSGFGIKRKKYKFWSLKDTITNKLISFQKHGNILEIELSKEDYYNALHCDIELFMNKSTVQYSDFYNSKNNSPCWSFVTLYYLAFFASTLFFRFLSKGFIYLTSEQKTRLEQYSLAINSEPIILQSGNYYFNLKEENQNGNIVLTLIHKKESLHKLNWKELESTFKELLPNCDDHEKAIYKAFLLLFDAFNAEFPSTLRNKLNYNGDSSIFDLEDTISYINLKHISSNFLKGLFNIGTLENFKNQIDSIGHLSFYLVEFNNKLYNEYIERSSFGKDFSKERLSYLTTKKISFNID